MAAHATRKARTAAALSCLEIKIFLGTSENEGFVASSDRECIPAGAEIQPGEDSIEAR